MGIVPDYREAKAEEEQGKASTEEGGLQDSRQMEEEDGISRRNMIQSPGAGHVLRGIIHFGAAFASFGCVRSSLLQLYTVLQPVHLKVFRGWAVTQSLASVECPDQGPASHGRIMGHSAIPSMRSKASIPVAAYLLRESSLGCL